MKKHSFETNKKSILLNCEITEIGYYKIVKVNKCVKKFKKEKTKKNTFLYIIRTIQNCIKKLIALQNKTKLYSLNICYP